MGNGSKAVFSWMKGNKTKELNKSPIEPLYARKRYTNNGIGIEDEINRKILFTDLLCKSRLKNTDKNAKRAISCLKSEAKPTIKPAQ